jgi:hypothetical protein
MASIFISHSSKDNAWAQRLKAWLEDKQHRSLFLDFNRETGLKAGSCCRRCGLGSTLCVSLPSA